MPGLRLNLFLCVFSALSFAEGINTAELNAIYPPVNPDCRVVTIQVKTAQDKHLHLGVGWIVQIGSHLRVVTPAHVVANARSIDLHCNLKKFSAQIVGESPEMDLALLKTEPTAELKPLALHPNPKLIGYDAWQALDKPYFDRIIAPWGTHEFRLLWDLVEQDKNWNFDLFHAGYNTVYSTHWISVARGMSGSPVVARAEEDAPPALSGMVTRTRLQNRSNFILPIKELFSALPELNRGKNPYITTEFDAMKWRSNCPNGQWNPVVGGTWGDGGGNAASSPEPHRSILKELYFKATSADFRTFSITNHAIPACLPNGVRDETGNRLYTFHHVDILHAIESVDQLRGFAAEKNLSAQQVSALFLPRVEAQKKLIRQYCARIAPNHEPKLKFGSRLESHSEVNLADGSTLEMIRESITPSLASHAESNAEISCSADLTEIRVVKRRARNDLIYEITITPQIVSIQVKSPFGSIAQTALADGWAYQIRSPDQIVQFTLGMDVTQIYFSLHVENPADPARKYSDSWY